MSDLIKNLRRIGLAAAAVFPLSPAAADTPDEDLEELVEQAEKVVVATNRIIVPIPVSDPQLGSGIGLGVAWLYRPGDAKVPWITGAGGMSTSNGSWGAIGFHSMSLSEDSLRISVSLGKGEMNTKYFPEADGSNQDSEFVDLNQSAVFGQGRIAKRIAGNLFVGAKVRYLDMKLTIGEDDAALSNLALPRGFDPDDPVQQVKQVAYGPVFSYDTTDASFSPRKGILVNGQWLVTDSSGDSEYSFNKADLMASEYFDVGKNSVLALRQSLCLASDETPFFSLCQFGSNSNIRGYVSGKYRDQASWSAQVEWRQHLFGKFGAVAFAGVGGVAEDFGGLGEADLLPAAGAGLRYLLAKDYGVNLRLDFAWGKDSSGVYVSLGEAF